METRCTRSFDDRPFNMSVQMRTWRPRFAVWYMSSDGKGSLMLTSSERWRGWFEFWNRSVLVYRSIEARDLHWFCIVREISLAVSRDEVEPNFWTARVGSFHPSCPESRPIDWRSIGEYLQNGIHRHVQSQRSFVSTHRHERDWQNSRACLTSMKSSKEKITTTALSLLSIECVLHNKWRWRPLAANVRSHVNICTYVLRDKSETTAVVHQWMNFIHGLFSLAWSFLIGSRFKGIEKRWRKTQNEWRHAHSVLPCMLHRERLVCAWRDHQWAQHCTWTAKRRIHFTGSEVKHETLGVSKKFVPRAEKDPSSLTIDRLIYA